MGRHFRRHHQGRLHQEVQKEFRLRWRAHASGKLDHFYVSGKLDHFDVSGKLDHFDVSVKLDRFEVYGKLDRFDGLQKLSRCGSVCRAVATIIRGLQFESSR